MVSSSKGWGSYGVFVRDVPGLDEGSPYDLVVGDEFWGHCCCRNHEIANS